MFNGTCNAALFENWVEQFLIKELNPRQVVIMDNATFHKSQRTKDLIESSMHGNILTSLLTISQSYRDILG